MRKFFSNIKLTLFVILNIVFTVISNAQVTNTDISVTDNRTSGNCFYGVGSVYLYFRASDYCMNIGASGQWKIYNPSGGLEWSFSDGTGSANAPIGLAGSGQYSVFFTSSYGGYGEIGDNDYEPPCNYSGSTSFDVIIAHTTTTTTCSVDPTQQICNNISSTASFNATNITSCSSTTIMAGATVTAVAANSISLSTGFTGSPGCTFSAVIGTPACTNHSTSVTSPPNTCPSGRKENVTTVNRKVDFLDLFPNPTDHSLNIALPSTEKINGNIMIFDSQGTKVYDYSSAVGLSSAELDVSFLTSGIYFITIPINQNVYQKKFMVQ